MLPSLRDEDLAAHQGARGWTEGMSTELTVASSNQLTAQPDYENAVMIRTLKETVCKGATDAQFHMFVEIARRTGLNPLLKEIWFVAGVGVMAGRDGYLRIANENPNFDGMETTVERDAHGIPIKATCRVWRKDRSHPITCEAYYNEYKKNSPVWQTYKSAMISKVAEVLALKRSFSINGLVSEEEIGETREQVAERRIAELQPEESPLQLEAPTPPTPSAGKSKKAAAPFDMLAPFAEIKKAIMELAGPEPYYKVLADFGYSKSNEIPDKETGRKVYKALAQVRADLQLKTDMLAQLKHAAEVLGIRAFSQILGNNGQECAEDIVNLEAEHQEKILAEIELAVKDKIGTEAK